MTDLNLIASYGFFELRLYELPSFLICLLLAIVLGHKYKLHYNYQILLILHCFVPFFLNDVLFSVHYMGDQLRYWAAVKDIRDGTLGIVDALNEGTVEKASFFLSLIPFPSPFSYISLGFYNTALYITLFFFLYKKNIFTKFSIWFYLLYPSVALYSGLSLRDTLIFVFMTLAVLYARENKVILSILCLFPLYLIKFQNFFIVGPIVLLYYLFKVSRNGMGIGKAFTVFIISLAGLLLSAPFAIPQINYFRSAMYREDGGEGEVELIGGIGDFIIEGLTSGVYFLVKPFIWEARGLLPLIQSFENTIILIILFLITRQAWRKSPDRLAFWLLFMAFSMSIYGLVVFNYGTAVRYRYSFVMIYVLFVCADCNIQELLPRRKKTTI